MAMNDALTLVVAWAAGMGLGALFFGGLWWTVRKAVSASQPALWFAGSLLLRTGVALAGLYLGLGPSLGADGGLPPWIRHGTPDRDRVRRTIGTPSHASDSGGQPCALVRTN